MSQVLSYEDWLVWTKADTMNQVLSMMKEHGLEQHESTEAELRASYADYVRRSQNAAG